MVDTLQLAPTASPTGTFVAPAPAPQTNKALELAESLGVLQKGVERYVDEKTRIAKEEGRRKGLLYSALNEKEAIEKGLITEFESPWFVKGQKEQRGRLSGDTYDAALTKAYLASGMRENTAPDAFQKFADQFREDYLDKLDPEMAKDSDFILGLGSKMTQSEQQLAEAHVSNASEKLRYDAVVGTQEEIYNQIAQQVSRGPVRPEDLIGPVTAIGARQKAFFLTGKEVSAAKIEAVGQAAIDFNRPDLLDVLDQPSHDGTPGPGLTIEGRAKVHAYKQQILSESIRRETYEREANDRYNRKKADELMVSAIRKVSDGHTITEADIRAGEAYDPEFRLKLISARKSISSDEVQEDVYGLKKAVNTGALQTTQQIYDYVELNDIKVTAATLESAIDQAKQVQSRVYSDPFVKGQGDIITSTLNPSGLGGLMGDSQSAAEAKARFAERVVSEVSPDTAGSQQWRDQIKKIREEVLKESQDANNTAVTVRTGKETANAKTAYFPSLQNLQNVSTLYQNGQTDELDAVLTKAGVRADDNAAVNKFLNDQKLLLEGK